MSPLRWSIVVLIGMAGGTGLGLGAHAMLPTSPYARGVSIGEHRIPDKGSAADMLEAERQAIRDKRVVLRYGEDLEEVTYGDFGVDIDIAKTLEKARLVAHTGDVFFQIKEAERAKRGEIDVPLVYTFDEAAATAILERIAEKVKREPIDARLVMAEKKKYPDVAGQRLDIEVAFESIRGADWSAVNGVAFDLPIVPVRAKVTLNDLIQVDVSKILSAWETTYATTGTGVGRSINIARAASFIDGAIIPPQATFSFNELVGPRTLERGFALAPEIQGDELTTGVGGGTCQVSSTLFAASLNGVLDIIERRSHSRPSAYAKLGLDATVFYGAVDLKLRNPYTFAIMVHAFVPKPGVVRVELLGGDPTADVSYSFGIGATEDFVRRITVKSWMKPGTRQRHQKGSPGYDVTSVVSIKWKDGRTEERKYFSLYRPAPEVFWVAPGYDEAELPPLPPRAKGVEGRLAETAPSVYDASSL
ncbi:MAG: VanW family protein [Polyangiaceae bacterium]